MGEDSGEKTEQPTPHKLREAREKGQVAKSKDLTTAFLLLASFYALNASAKSIWNHLSSFSITIYTYIAEDLTYSVAGHVLNEVLEVFALCVGPIFLVNLAVALIVELLQTGFLVSFEAIVPDINKLNPIEGAKKFFTLKQYVELFKSVIKMGAVVLIIFFAIRDDFTLVILSQQFSLLQTMSFTGQLVMKVITRVGILYIVIAILDYAYQRYEYIKGLKMTKKEIKDEYKRLEGDVMVKRRQRDTARQMAQGRQMGSVPDSDVIVTNPIHFAIAIRYNPNTMKAPVITAKGKRLIALSIRSIAEDARVPIVESPPLARQLYDEVEIGDEVPPLLYKAVAEILAFVYNLNQNKAEIAKQS